MLAVAAVAMGLAAATRAAVVVDVAAVIDARVSEREEQTL